MSEQSAIMTIKDVMSELKIGRRKATALLEMKSCPKMPRKKGQQYLVSREAFYTWLKEGFR